MQSLLIGIARESAAFAVGPVVASDLDSVSFAAAVASPVAHVVTPLVIDVPNFVAHLPHAGEWTLTGLK